MPVLFAIWSSTYFCIDKILNSKKKILWVNTDLEKAHYNVQFLEKYYLQADCIVADSINGQNNLKRLFPDCSKRTYCFQNLVNVEQIKRMSLEEVDISCDKSDRMNILTVGRLVEAKAIHMAVEVASILKSRGFSFKWFIVGDGNQRKQIYKQIKELGLEDVVIMLGAKPNPYPFFKFCDVYVQTSIYEGSCMTINEALCFNKPVVTTDFPAAFEKIKEGENGYICNMNAVSVANSLEKLFVKENLLKMVERIDKSNKLIGTSRNEFYKLL